MITFMKIPLIVSLGALIVAVSIADAQVPQPTYRSFDQILGVLPLGLKQDLQNNAKQAAALADANRLLQQNVAGKTAFLKVRPLSVSTVSGKTAMSASAGPFQIGGRKCDVAIKVTEEKAFGSLLVSNVRNKQNGSLSDLPGTITSISLDVVGKNAFRLEVAFD